MLFFRLIYLTITCNELLWSNSTSFFFFFFFSYKGNNSIGEYYFFFEKKSVSLVSRDGSVFVCFYRRVPFCLFVLLSIVVVAKMYVLFMNVA